MFSIVQYFWSDNGLIEKSDMCFSHHDILVVGGIAVVRVVICDWYICDWVNNWPPVVRTVKSEKLCLFFSQQLFVIFLRIHKLFYYSKLKLKCLSVWLQKMQTSHRPVQWLAVMLLVICAAGQCQQNERWDLFTSLLCLQFSRLLCSASTEKLNLGRNKRKKNVLVRKLDLMPRQGGFHCT